MKPRISSGCSCHPTMRIQPARLFVAVRLTNENPEGCLVCLATAAMSGPRRTAAGVSQNMVRL
jgi:hypothetical protein